MPNKIMTVTFWIILLCMTKQTEQEQAVVQSWCSVNAAYKGDKTTLTCSFDQDVSTSKPNIHLQHKTANGFEDILIYDWSIGRALFKGQNYQVQLEGIVTNSLTVINMNVSLDHAGSYRCVVGVSEGKECELIIKEHQAPGMSPFGKTMIFIMSLYVISLLPFLVIWILRILLIYQIKDLSIEMEALLYITFVCISLLSLILIIWSFKSHHPFLPSPVRGTFFKVKVQIKNELSRYKLNVEG